jgi:chaperonin GroEL (HSP60 family)
LACHLQTDANPDPDADPGYQNDADPQHWEKIYHFTCERDFYFIIFFSLQEYRSLLEKCAATSMSSKLIHQQKEFFSKMVVDAVMMLDDLLPLNMIGIKKVQGGALEDTVLVPGVAFKKTFSYAGFEMQRKAYKNPKIALLNIELELKAEKDNAEVSVIAAVLRSRIWKDPKLLAGSGSDQELK